MCGLVGMARPSECKSWDKFFQSLLFFDQVRGIDSTGVASIAGENIRIVKRSVCAQDFFDMKAGSDVINQAATFKIGHNRYATKGAINNVNAHPYQYGDITLAHNGTLRGAWGNILHVPDDADTDSAALANTMNILGVDELFKLPLTGAWGLSWHDAKDNSVNLLTNGERPLYMAKLSYQPNLKQPYFVEAIAWASEPWMIDVSAERQGIEVVEMVEVKPGDWHKITKENNKIHTTIHKEVEFYKEKKCSLFPSRSNTHLPSGTRPSPSKALVTPAMRKRFNKLGIPFAPGSVIDVCFYDFKESKNQGGKGKMLGYMMNDPWLSVEIPNVQECTQLVNHTIQVAISDVRTERVKGGKDEMVDNHILIGNAYDLYEFESYYIALAKEQSSVKKTYSPDKMLPGPQGIYIPVLEWDALTEDGCGLCATPLTLGMADYITWVPRDVGGHSPLCSACANSLIAE